VSGIFVPPLLPESTEETAGFFDGASMGELRVQSCGVCGRLRHPPRVRCPACHSGERTWRAVSGRGRLWSFVVAHPPLLPAFADLAPYTVALVELDDDPRIRIVGSLVARVGDPPGAIDPGTLTIGEPVTAVFHQVRGIGYLQWLRSAGA
jgi:uncharacterized OB-fold protein